MNLLVIHEKDHDDDEEIVIGVAESVEMAEDMIKEYYGEGKYIEISKQDIRDSSLEYSKILEIKGITDIFHNHRVTITLQWFQLNKL
jgi:non-homologous end joining protein Ku